MSINILKRGMHINASIQEVWDFFSEPKNLSLITPPYMKLKVMKQSKANDIYAGMRIEYRVRPILNIPLKWVTVIENVSQPYSFTDVQITGPYRLWRHYHSFTETDNGVLMQDEVHYNLPLGWLGDMAHFLFVRKQLEGIFDYREKVIRDFF